MRHTLILIFIVAITHTVFSQDLLVTTKGDSLNCKILKVTKNEIRFAYIQDGLVKDSSLSKPSISIYKFNRFAVNDTLEELANIPKKDYSNYRVAINYGLGYMLAPLSDDISNDLAPYFIDLKSGSLFSGDVAYFFSSYLGIGLKYTQFNTVNSKYPIYEIDDRTDITLRTGSMSDDISIVFVGPYISTRVPSMYRNDAFLMNLSLGYMGYRNDKVVFDDFLLKGKTIGLSLDFGYDIGFSKNIAMGIQLSLYSGYLSKYVMTDNLGSRTIILGEEQYESLSRLDLTIGLRFMHE